MTNDLRAVLALLLQHAHELDSTGEVHRELKTRVLSQAKVEMVRDRPFDEICETLFMTAFDLGRAFESWQRSLPEAAEDAS